MIVCASLWKRNYQLLADVTTPNKTRYADKHGYLKHFVVVPDDCDIMFVKIEVIFQAMKAIKNGDWVWFSDCDSVVTNMNKKVSDLIDEEAGIVVSNDFNGINSGSMLVKKDARTIEYLCWVLTKQGIMSCEQAAMQQTLDSTSMWDGLIKIVPQNCLNSYDYKLPSIEKCGMVNEKILKNGQWKPGDLLIHFPATDLQRRVEFCRKYDREALNGN